MLTKANNELVCRVGPDTAMGAAMRHFWIPALLSREIAEPDSDPVHVELLGENFVAFRDTEGKVGILDELCPHRGVSLTVGRVENCGLRCIYHGWLYGADGTVLETPNVLDPSFKTRFKAKAYPVRESAGMIWVYLGDEAKQPAFPDFGFIGSPSEMRINAVQIIGANYLQIMEGTIDSSHLSVLHSTSLELAEENPYRPSASMDHMRFDTAPRIESEETDFGVHYAAMRDVGGKQETRVCSFISPFWVCNPNSDMFHCFVPLTDEKTAFYHVWWDGVTKFGENPSALQRRVAIGLDDATLEAHGMTRKTFDGPDRPSRANGWKQDRASMRSGHFSGMAGISQEDVIASVAGGPIRDRSNERLSLADRQLAHVYRVLLKSAKNAAEGGVPVGYNQPVGHIVGANGQLELGSDWRILVPQHRPLEQEDAA
jgi:phenylpropionate dioxygenase-like ring-hydroxylating dioxygenase large terminal subunit